MNWCAESNNMPDSNANDSILELRMAITTSDYERLLKFYTIGLGVEPAQFWQNGQGHAAILNLGRATLEIFDEAQVQTIDEIEVGQRVSGPVRFALQVPDLQAALDRLLVHGVTRVHPPVQTPWGDLNARVQDPDGLQVTLFQAQKQA